MMCSPVVTLLSPESPKVIVKGGLFDRIPEPTFESFAEDKPSWMNVAKAG